MFAVGEEEEAMQFRCRGRAGAAAIRTCLSSQPAAPSLHFPSHFPFPTCESNLLFSLARSRVSEGVRKEGGRALDGYASK